MKKSILLIKIALLPTICMGQSLNEVFREEYYAHLPFWESPYQPFKGASPITKAEADKRIHLQFDYDKDNRIVAVHVKLGEHYKEFEGFFGNLYINAPLTKIVYDSNKEYHSFYDRFGNQTTVQGHVYTKVYEKDSHGRNIKLTFLNEAGETAVDMFGVQHYIWLHQTDGSIIEERFDAKGDIVALRGQFELQRTRMFFDEQGYFKILQNIDDTGNMVNTENGVAQYHYYYDKQGRFDRWEVYDASGNKAIGPSNTSGEQNIHDQYDLKNIVFFDTNGDPATHWSGAQIWHFEVDRFGNRIVLEFQDDNGKPMNANNNYAKRVWEWSSDGRFLLSESYFDENGQPINHKLSGVHKVIHSRNEKGVIVNSKRYDTNHNLVEQVKRNNQTKYYTNLAGIISPNLEYLGRGEISSEDAKILKHYKFTYENNKILKIQYFDKEQPNDNSYYGTHEVRYDYLDNKLIRSYYNTNGNKATAYRHYYLGDNIHHEVFEIDKKNNKTSLTLKDSLNNQIGSGLGSYVFKFEKIDERTFIQTQFKKDGSPNILTTYFPFYKAKISTEKRGFLYSITNVDDFGNIAMHKDAGYASIVFDFDNYGNELGWSFKDNSNNLSNRKDYLNMDYGFAKVVYNFNWENKKLGLHNGFEEAYFDKENKPVENDKGIHLIKYEYDKKGIFKGMKRFNLDGFDPEKDKDNSIALSISNYLANIGSTPIRFEVDKITTSSIEYGGSLSLEKQEIVFTRATDDFSSRNMMISEFKNGKFSNPKKIEIGGTTYNNASDVQLSTNDDYLYFKMPGLVPNDSTRKDSNIWRSKRNGNQWEPVELLPEAINSELNEYYPIVTNSGNLYFSRQLKDTSYDIYVSKFINGTYQKAERLPNHINTNLLESDAYVSPDESYMIFVRMYAEEGLGVSDLYISFNNSGVWSKPKNMRSINSNGVDGSPFVTSDGKYLLFTSTRDSKKPEVFDGHLDIYIVKFNIEDWR